MASRPTALLPLLTKGRSDSDRDLLERFARAKDEAAFEALVHRHGNMVLATCQRVLANTADAEDACQATFIVLARKAKSIKWESSVASWLYATARHVAQSARTVRSRRLKYEGQAPTKPLMNPLAQITAEELLTILEDELVKLPARYRDPVVLCCLEGLSRDEAARRLNVPLATLKGQLERGRRRLHDALERRGVTLGVGLLAILATSRVGAFPARIANQVLAAVRGSPPSTVAELSRGVVVNGILKKCIYAVVLTAMVTTLIVGVGFVPPTAAEPLKETTAPDSKKSAALPVNDKDEIVDVSGRVVDPDGQPFVGATLSIWTRTAKHEDRREIRSEKDGRFSIKFRRSDLQDRAVLIAMAKGFGPDWIDLPNATGREITLKLANDDVPIVGRIINLEGQGVAGATMRVRRMEKRVDDGNLDAFIATKQKWAKGDYVSGPELKELKAAAMPMPTSATTDANGKFKLSGFGRERVLSFSIEGTAIEPICIEVLTRTGVVDGLFSGNENEKVYGATFEQIVPPGKTIEGVVRDKENGKPLVGITVSCGRCWATTDAEGRYKIQGPPKKDVYSVTAYGVPYFDVTKSNVNDTPGFLQVHVNFELERGLALSGRVLDKVTGKPIRAKITYMAFKDNPYLKEVSGVGPGGSTNEDGSFTFTGLPGPGLLAVIADDDDYVKFDSPAERDPVPSINWIPAVAHAFVRIDPSEKDPKTTTFEIKLEPAVTVQAEVIGLDGKPFTDYYVAGQTASPRSTVSWLMPKSSPKFTIRGLQKSRPRTVVLLSKDLKFGKAQAISAEARTMQIRMEPLGSVTGRIVGAEGRPMAGVFVHAALNRKAEAFDKLPIQLLFDSNTWVAKLQPTTKSDSDGKFRLNGLMPGLAYTLAASDSERELVRVNSLSMPASGKTQDLGELKCRPAPKE